MKDTYEIIYEAGNRARVLLFNVNVVSDYFAPGSTERSALTISVAGGPPMCIEPRDILHPLKWFNEVPLGQFKKQLAVTYGWFCKNYKRVKVSNDEQTSSNDLTERIRALGPDELAIIGELVGRIEKGRKSYGPWALDKINDYPQEVIEEVLDALNYCAAALLQLRRQRKLLLFPNRNIIVDTVPAKAGDELPWAPDHIKRAPREPQAKPVRSGGIEEFDARRRVKQRCNCHDI